MPCVSFQAFKSYSCWEAVSGIEPEYQVTVPPERASDP